MSGVRALAYIVVQGPVEEWKSFGTDLLGAQAARHTADEVRLRTDERAWRIAVEAGPASGLLQGAWLLWQHLRCHANPRMGSVPLASGSNACPANGLNCLLRCAPEQRPGLINQARWVAFCSYDDPAVSHCNK